MKYTLAGGIPTHKCEYVSSWLNWKCKICGQKVRGGDAD